MIFVRGCVIEANQNDSHNDILTKEDIKKINRNLGDIQFDTQHNRETFNGCRVIENTVYDNPVTIDNTLLNEGSWVITLEVDNPKVEERISTGELQGFSLFSYAGGETSYNDVMDKADIYPIFLSFVHDPANQIPFEVLSEDEYISKSENKIMADDQNLLDKIKELLISEEQETTEPVPEEDEAIKKEEEPAPAEPVAEEESPAEQEEDEIVEAEEDEKAVVKECKPDDEGAVSKAEDITEEEEIIEEVVSNAEIKELLLEVISLLTEKDEVSEEEETNDDDVEVKKYIVKQSTQKNMNITEPVKQSKARFDLFGRKL